MDRSTLVVDISDPAAPVYVGKGPPLPSAYGVPSGQQQFDLGLPNWLEDSSDEERLSLHSSYWTAFRSRDGLLANVYQGEVSVFQWTSTRNERAIFDKIGHRPATPLERFFAGGSRVIWIGDHLVAGNEQYSIAFTAYDLRVPAQPKKVGHFAVPNQTFGAMTATSDGRLLLATDRLYIFDPADWKR